MHVLKTAVMIAGLVCFASACSSGLEDDAKPLEGTSAFEAAFRTYDLNGDNVVSAEELLRVEKAAKSKSIVDETSAADELETWDMSADKVLDKVEFTGLLEKNILVGLRK